MLKRPPFSLFAGALLFVASATHAAPITFDILFDERLGATTLSGWVTFEQDDITSPELNAAGNPKAAVALDWEVTEVEVASGALVARWTTGEGFMLGEADHTGTFRTYGILVDTIDPTHLGYWSGVWGRGFLTSLNLGGISLQTAAASPTAEVPSQPSIPEPSAALVFPLGIGIAWFARRRVTQG